MTSRKLKTVPSPEHLSDEGHSLPIYINIQQDTAGNTANPMTSPASPSNRTFANASQDDDTKNPAVPLSTPDKSPKSNLDSQNPPVYESLTIAPVSRVRDSVSTCMFQCSRERRLVVGIAMSALVLGFLLGFLPTYFVFASGGPDSPSPTCGPDIACPTCGPEISCPTCGPGSPCPTCGPDISCPTCGPDIPFPTSGPEMSCPPGFTQSPLVSKCYRFVLIPLQWEEARDHCRGVGGVLLELTNLADLRGFVTLANQETVQIEGALHFWTGGLRVEPNVIGSPFMWDATGEALPRDSPLWNWGEPNNSGGTENYVEVFLPNANADNRLNDKFQRESFSICESPLLV